METTLLNMCDNILRNMENGKFTSIVSLDLSAAFNTVNHTILLDILNGYFGISELALTWISSYLSSRKLLVQKGHLTSRTAEIDFLVPQGSILGPILFNCYAGTLMEIIPERKDSFLSGYGDDHAIIHSFSPDNNNIKQIMQEDIGKIKTWMEENQLKMKDAKTVHSHRNIKQPPEKYLRQYWNWKYKNSLVIKNQISWSISRWKTELQRSHSKQIKKASYNLRLISNIWKYIDIDSTKMLLCTLVPSQLDLVNSILSMTPKTITKPYKTVQNFVARVAYKKSRREDVYMCLQQLQWLPIK